MDETLENDSANAATAQSPPMPTAPPDTEALTNVTPTSSSAPPVRPSALPKPSGLKPPSKIGRLCSNSTPKPAVPISPRSDCGSSDTLRKLSDDYSRKHLSDLVEAEEDGEVSSSLPSDRIRPHRKASTSSTFSITSMDALWEKHPRRLSEAGLRRSSDHSVVLTEDTDGFIIGDRVWVGGSKSGQIAYIGETQFAPGEWAGIVLDDPIGKNDGSVAGVRYFQCAERRGVFSRLTRLTRAPLFRHDASPSSDAGSVFERPPSGAASHRRALSPNGSVRSAVSSRMNMSVSTSGGELRMGERVIVSSSRGSKAGTLRYVGVTEFAGGVWAGVELDDPLGKNDGSVEGKRYFECSPRFGLFAPISKVSRSPSNRKPGACAIHSNGRATPVRRSNSRDSLTSLGTSVASSRVAVRLGGTSLGGAQRAGAPRASSTPVSAKNALQELLREKQQHLERIMKERELERADMAKATLHANRTETALQQLKNDTAITINENGKLKIQLERLNKLLEDERQKVEDLMFRNEEENINKEDYNKYREAMERELASMERRISELEAEAVLREAHAEATAGQHREELAAAHTLSTELQKLLDEAYALLKEKENEKDSIGKSMTEELSKLKMELEKALNDAKTKMAIAKTEFDTQLSVLNAKLQVAESKLEIEKQNVEKLNKDSSQTVIDLNSKLSQLQAALDDKTHELNKVLGTTKEHELNFNKEITKLKMELSAKILDLEHITEVNKKYSNDCKVLETEVARVKEEMNFKLNEYETLLNEASQQNEQSKMEVLELKQSLTTKIKEYEKLMDVTGATNITSEKLINEYKETIHERDKEIIKLKNDYEQANANFNIQQSKIAEEYRKEIENRNDTIEKLIKEIENYTHTLETSKVEFDTLNSKFIINVDEIKLLRDQNEELRQTVNQLTEVNTNMKNKISSMELEIGEFKRQLNSNIERCSELQKAKEKVENEYLNLTGQTTDSNEQFNKLTHHLKETEKQLQELKDKYRESLNNYGRSEQELKQQIFKIQEEYTSERSQLICTINEAAEKSKLQETNIKDYATEVDALKEIVKGLELGRDKIFDENTILKKDITVLKNKELELNEDYEKLRKNMEEDIDKYKEKVLILKAEGETSEVKLKEKVDQLIEAQNELNNKLEEALKHEDSLQKVIDNMTLQIENQKMQHEKELAQNQSHLIAAKDEGNTHKSDVTKMKELLQEKEDNVKALNLKISMYEVDLKSNVDIVAEKDRQLNTLNEELSKVVQNKNNLEEKIISFTKESSELKQKYDAIVANSSVEESIFKEKTQQIESLTTDLTLLKQEKNSIEATYTEVCDQLDNMKKDYVEINNNLQETIKVNTKLKKSLEEKDLNIKKINDTIEADVKCIQHQHREISKLQQDLSDKNNEILAKDQHLAKLKESLDSSNKETQLQVKSLQNQNLELSNKYQKEIDVLIKTINLLKSQVSAQQNLNEESIQNKNKISELQNLLDKSEKDIKELNNINEGQKKNYEDLNQQLQLQYDELKKETKKVKGEHKSKLSEYENELQASRNKFSEEVEKHVQLKQAFDQSKNDVVELTNKLELLTVQQNTNDLKDDKLEKLTLELQATRKTNAESLANSESIIRKLKSDIENKARDMEDKANIIVKLQEELKNQKAKTEISEREKALLEKNLASQPKDTMLKDNNDNGLMSLQDDTQKVQEVEGQVSFLNSVIVDMQRKNEQLQARVRALEGATSPESTLYNETPRTLPPRLFCDICEVFDAHDTEECPRQSAAPASPPPLRRAPLPPRPYCDICEVFGHATENCDEEETF